MEGGGVVGKGKEEEAETEEGGGKSCSSAAPDSGERQVAKRTVEGGALQQHAIRI